MTSTAENRNRGLNGLRHFIRRSWAPLVLVIGSLAMSLTVTSFHTPAMSPIDEWVYIDYLYKLPVQGFVREGEVIGPEALQLMACSGEKAYGPMGPPCESSKVGSGINPELFPYAGKQSAFAYTPLYFVPTFVVAKAIQLATGADFLNAARFTGSLWLVGTMLLFFALFRAFKVNRLVTVAIGLAFIGSPFAWWTYTYISTDIPSVGISALLLLAAKRFIDNRWSGWWVVLLSVAAILFKTANILAVGLTALYLVISFVLFHRRDRPFRSRDTRRAGLLGRGPLGLVTIALVSVFASAATQALWQLFQKAQSLGSSADQGVGVPLTPETLLSQLTNFLPNTINSNVNLVGGGVAYKIPDALVTPLSWLCIAGVIGGLLVLKRGSRDLDIAYAVGIASVACAPLLALLLYVTLVQYYPIPPRYGASILIGFLLMGGIIARNNFFVKWLLLGYGVALILFVMFTAHGYAR